MKVFMGASAKDHAEFQAKLTKIQHNVAISVSKKGTKYRPVCLHGISNIDPCPTCKEIAEKVLNEEEEDHK